MQIKSQSNKSIFAILWERQKFRYKQKGLVNCIVAFLLLYVVLAGGTWVGKYLWPQNIKDPLIFTLISTLIIHVTCQLLYFLIFLPGYLGHSFYQKYLINKSIQKPWQKQNWSYMRLRTIWYLFLNKGVVFPLLIYSSMKFSGLKTRFDNFPSVG